MPKQELLVPNDNVLPLQKREGALVTVDVPARITMALSNPPSLGGEQTGTVAQSIHSRG